LTAGAIGAGIWLGSEAVDRRFGQPVGWRRTLAVITKFSATFFIAKPARSAVSSFQGAVLVRHRPEFQQ
jgi:hypothetical protein